MTWGYDNQALGIMQSFFKIIFTAFAGVWVYQAGPVFTNGLLWVVKCQALKREARKLPFLNMLRIYGSNPPLKRMATHQVLLLFSIVIIILHIHYCYKWKLYYS